MIAFDLGHAHFKYRVAAVCIDQGYVLLQQFAGYSFWCLPGGRVEMMESAETTIRREMQEELGLEVQVERALWIAENFFEGHQERPYHELGWYFLISLPPGCALLEKQQVVQGVDGETQFALRWFPIDALQEVELYPPFLRQRLAALPITLEHIVEYE